MTVVPERLKGTGCTDVHQVAVQCRAAPWERMVIWRCAPAPDGNFGNCRMPGVGRGLWRLCSPPTLAQAELIAQVRVQIPFQYLQGWRLHRCSGWPAPVLLHPHSQRCLLTLGERVLCLICANCLLSYHWTPLKRAWLCGFDAILSGIYPHWSGTPCPEPSPGWQSPLLHPFLTGELL